MAAALLPFALTLVLALHLAAAGLAAAGPLVALALDLRGTRRDDRQASAVGRWLLAQSTFALLLAIGFGALALGGVWLLYPHVVAVTVGRFPLGRYWFGAVELGFSLACLTGCLALWPRAPTTSPDPRWRRRFLGVLAATNTIYHFPTLFAALSVMSGWTPSLAQQRFVSVLARPETLARVGHFVSFAFVVVGCWLAARGRAASVAGRPEAAEAQAADRWARCGGIVALVAGTFSLVSGVTLLAAVDPAERELLLGGNAWATGLLGAAVVGSLGLLHSVAKLALGETGERARSGALRALAVVLVLMVGVRQRTRELTAGPHEAAAARLRTSAAP